MLKRKKVLLIVLPIVIAMVAGAGVLYYFVFSGSVLKKEDTYIPRNAVNEYSDDYNEKMGNFTAKTTVGALKGKLENTCYSPAGLYATLCMSAELMTEEAVNEVLEALGYKKISRLETGYKYMIKKLSDESDLSTISLCNSLWINEVSGSDEEIKEITDNCMEKLECDIYRKNFTSDEINNWIYEKTNGMMNGTISSADDPLYLISACYYKADWKKGFKEADSDKFILYTGQETEVKYMTATNKTKYVKGENYIATKMDFEDDAEMIFVLPDERKTVEDIVEENTINEILASFASRNFDRAEIILTVPEFRYDFSLGNSEIAAALNSIGISKFLDESSWSTLYKGKIDGMEITQDAMIAVDKEGVEASITYNTKPQIIGVEDEEEMRKINITIDKPFMYILVKNGTPLFIGTVYNPNEK